jgi:hypothetical protein
VLRRGLIAYAAVTSAESGPHRSTHVACSTPRSGDHHHLPCRRAGRGLQLAHLVAGTAGRRGVPDRSPGLARHLDPPRAGHLALRDGSSRWHDLGISRYKRDAVVTVSLNAANSTEITVLGEVGSQRTFPIQRETRLIEALGQVGGVGMMADKDNIRIIRLVDGQSHIYYADVGAIEMGDLSTNYMLQGGDVIVVPPTTSAKIGYAVQAFTFPIQQILGFGAKITNTVLMP